MTMKIVVAQLIMPCYTQHVSNTDKVHQMLTLINATDDEYAIVKTYACDLAVITSGDGIWGCEAGRAICVSEIAVSQYKDDDGELEDYLMIDVKHDSTWDIYTDKGFEAAISAALGYPVFFTEQGMQEDGVASMET